MYSTDYSDDAEGWRWRGGGWKLCTVDDNNMKEAGEANQKILNESSASDLATKAATLLTNSDMGRKVPKHPVTIGSTFTTKSTIAFLEPWSNHKHTHRHTHTKAWKKIGSKYQRHKFWCEAKTPRQENSTSWTMKAVCKSRRCVYWLAL